MDELEAIFGTTGTGAAQDAGLTADAARARVESDAERANAPASTTPMTEMAHYVMSRFRENADFRRTSGTDERLRYALEAQSCHFTEEQRAKLLKTLPAATADKIFAPITSTKIRAAKAMLIDLANQSGEPLFRIEPTPSPEVPEQVTEEAAVGVMREVQQLFGALARAGIGEIPPDQAATLQTMIAKAVENRYDDIANSVEEYARVRAKRMEKKVWDIMLEGGWNEAFAEFIDYVCTYGTGVLVGPVMRTVAKSACVERRGKGGRRSGIRNYRRTYRTIPVFEAVNPQDCYPAPDAKDVGDGPLCIRVKYTADELWRFADAGNERTAGDGWIVGALRGMLARHPAGGVRIHELQFDPTRRFCERNGVEDTNDCTFEGVRCFASVRGSQLLEMGIAKTPSGDKVERTVYYRVEVIVVDNQVVYCRIYDDAASLPVSKGVFYVLPGAWWGESIADKVAMSQCVLNNCIKALLQNMPASSGAIYWVNDVQRMLNKSPDALRLRAGMTVPFSTSMVGNTGAPIGAVTVPSNAGELLQVWQRMQTQADLDSGIPAFTEGQSAGQSGALRTASGLAIYTEASTRGMKMVMTSFDRDVIGRTARLVAEWVLINDGDMGLKGDVDVKPVGLIGKILKAQRDQQRLQLFNMVASNPTLAQLVGAKGLVSLFRPSLMDVDVNPDDILPSRAKLDEMDLIAGIKAVNEAANASAQTMQAGAEAQQPGGAPPGIEQPPAVQGGVAERRAVA